MHRVPRLLVVFMLLLGAAGMARAADVSIIGLKLIVVDNSVGHGNRPTQTKPTALTTDPSMLRLHHFWEVT